MMALTARRFFAVEATQVDPVEESEFFSGLKMRNGTFKLTRPSRFADLDAEIASAISERAGGIRQVLDCDKAVATGSAS